MNRGIYSEEDGWVDSDLAVNHKLFKKGYAVGGFTDNGAVKYMLYRMNDEKVRFERVHEFNSVEELNNMLKLLIEEGD